MHATGMKMIIHGIKRSLIGSAFVLFWDVLMDGSSMFSNLSCPVWFVLSLVTTSIKRPGWGLALVRIAIPALTLALSWANSAIQANIAETNAQRVILACDQYRAAHDEYPKKLDELVPQYLKTIPVAKHCLTGSFQYYNFGQPMLYWRVFGLLRKIYDFETRSWNYVD